MDRRAFSAGLSACLSLMGIRPAWSEGTTSGGIDGRGVSPRLAELADAWFETGLAYERAHRVYCYGGGEPTGYRLVRSADSPERLALLRSQKALVHTAAPVLREPARTADDVILKYHVIDMQNGWWPLDDLAWAAIGGGALYERVLREAREFGVGINPFWLNTASLFAEIHGERHSPRWEAVSRWRTPKYQSVV